MKKFALLLCLISMPVFSDTAQDEEIKNLKKQVSDLSEIVDENSRLIKAQLKDQHIDQNSKGYLEFKIGKSILNPEDLEDENKTLFNEADESEWDNFESSVILEIEIGKTLFVNDRVQHQFGIGFQDLRSNEMNGSLKQNGGNRVKVEEKISFQTIYLRYASLFTLNSNRSFFLGPGATVGYAPAGKLVVQLESDEKGERATAEAPAALVELFLKAKFDFARYFSLVATAGYRLQEAEDARLVSGDTANVNDEVDLDVSGAFSTIGIAASF